MQVFLGKGTDVRYASILLCKPFSLTSVDGMYFPQLGATIILIA